MKRIIIVIGLIFLLAGCTNIKNLSLEQIIGTIGQKPNKQNVYRTGYKYFLPRGLAIDNSEEFNEVLNDGKYNYYLYVDALSYIKKVDNRYQPNDTSYYSREINNGDLYGYIEINLVDNDKYLIEIMYNYAKIEVIVDESNINDVLLTSINVLKSIKYNDSIINNLFGKNILNYMEEEFNIFHTTSSDSTYIQIDDTYYEEEETLPDTDLIN